jgi:hypothetical protein
LNKAQQSQYSHLDQLKAWKKRPIKIKMLAVGGSKACQTEGLHQVAKSTMTDLGIVDVPLKIKASEPVLTTVSPVTESASARSAVKPSPITLTTPVKLQTDTLDRYFHTKVD